MAIDGINKIFAGLRHSDGNPLFRTVCCKEKLLIGDSLTYNYILLNSL
jgi:hypothetical protein